MRKSKPEWGRIQRALKDPVQDFVCYEQDLATAEGRARHQDAFMADEWVRYIMASDIAGEIWCQVASYPLPPATDWPSFLEQRRKAFYAILYEALHAKWREDKRQRREAKRLVSLDAPIGTGEEGEEVTLRDVLGKDDPLPPDLDALFDALTEREGQVALLLASSYTQADVAEELGLSPGRVSQIVASLRRKLR